MVNLDIDSVISTLLGSSVSSGVEDIPPSSLDEFEDSDLDKLLGTSDTHYQDPTRGEGDHKYSGDYSPHKQTDKRHVTGHKGIDLFAPKGTPLYPLGPGKVTRKTTGKKSGNIIIIEDENGVRSSYMHLDSFGDKDVGDSVSMDDVIGYVGDTGNAKGTSPHLHFEVHVGGSLINPKSIFGKSIESYASNDYYREMRTSHLQKITKKIRINSLQKLAAEVDLKFELTPKEKQIFDLLRMVAENNGVVIRAAGGWVRDKLLGKDSNDIDIAVDKMSGYHFASLVLDFMKENGITTADGVAKVEENPDQSKSIETGILPVYGIPIDFVQLRRETYEGMSRIPEVEVGDVSAEEDAKRRDLTINSIFYNINDNKLEDFVGGIEDLKNNIARTPIDPLSTFMEDPLRILRAIRFGAKYNLDLDPALVEAANHPDVKDAFRNKISKERIWAEFAGQPKPEGFKRGFMVGPNFYKAVMLLKELGLRDIILTPSEVQLQKAYEKKKRQDDIRHAREAEAKNISIEELLENKEKHPIWEGGFGQWDLWQDNPHHNLNIWDHTVKALKYLNEMTNENISDEEERTVEDEVVRNIALLLHDIGKCDSCSTQIAPAGHKSYVGHEISSAFIADEILRDLKAPNKIRERIVSLIKHHMRLHHLPEEGTEKGLRRVIKDVGPKDFRYLVEMSKADSMGKKDVELSSKYDEFLERSQKTKDEPLKQSWLNGKEVMDALNLKPGWEIGVVMRALDEKYLDDPDAFSSKEEAIEFIKNISLEKNASKARTNRINALAAFTF